VPSATGNHRCRSLLFFYVYTPKLHLQPSEDYKINYNYISFATCAYIRSWEMPSYGAHF